MDIDQKNIPKEWYCPITQELMTDPVLAADGFTYEKKAIQQWFARSDHSPLTNIKLPNTNLIPNHALRHTIAQFTQKYKEKEIPSHIKKPALNLPKLHYELPQLKLNIDSALDSTDPQPQLYVKLQLQPPLQPAQKRNPCSIICILDISESMDTDSVMGGKDVESHGFSRLDLVKHSINTMVQFMDDCDQIALVPFSTSAQVALPVTRMDKRGKDLVKQTTKHLATIGTTNIWDGFKVSIDILKQLNKREKNHNIFIVLLTDGQPNLNPPRGIVPTLIKFLALQKLPTPNIHVFGYGYELDTQLLTEISEVGHGTYTYIPDCSMVGTAFVNFMATALSTITNDVVLKFEEVDKKYEIGKVGEVVGYRRNEKGEYCLGVLQYGQRREVVIRYPARILQDMTENEPTKLATVVLKYSQNSHTISKQLTLSPKTAPTSPQKLQKAITRTKYLSLLGKLMKQKKSNLAACTKMIDEFYLLVEKLYEGGGGQDEFLEVLMKEIKNTASENQGQVWKAFEKEEWYEKWGRHYIPSLFRAHLMQTCTNFKDPALQLYGGPLFEENRSTMDTIFIKMAPPQPSAKKVEKLVYKPAPVDMSDYYNYGGGCIDGDCLVDLADGTSKRVKELRVGDRVVGGVVKCVVRTNVQGWVEMTRIGQLLITPWHPIRVGNSWHFPTLYPGSTTSLTYIQSYFNFVLQDSQPSLRIEGIECIVLGHKLNDNPVTAHEYLSEAIVRDLERARGWAKGQIVVGGFVRDQTSRRIVGIRVIE